MKFRGIGVVGVTLLASSLAEAQSPEVAAPPEPSSPAPAAIQTTPPAPPVLSPSVPPVYWRPAPPAQATKRHSPALQAGGIVLIGFGVLSLVGGSAAIIGDLAANGSSQFGGYIALAIGLPLTVHGVGCLVGGIRMYSIGGREIPVAPTAPSPWARPQVSVGPGSASVRWAF